MGCLDSFADFISPYGTSIKGPGDNLPRRKVLCPFYPQKGYKILNIPFSTNKIKNSNYVYFIGEKENTEDRILVILDTKTLKSKYETPITMLQEITYPIKDEMKISFPCYNGKQGYDITLKLAPDNITEISKKPIGTTYQQWKEKQEEFKKIGEELHRFDNGNILYILNSEDQNSTGKYLALKDKNLEEITKINLGDDYITYTHSSSSDKYTAILAKNSITSLKTIEIYTIPDLFKICEFPEHKIFDFDGKRNPSSITSLFIPGNRIILGFDGEINICNIMTNIIEKTFTLDIQLMAYSHYRLDDGTFVSNCVNGVVYHWKIDGTVISKSRGEVCDYDVISYLADNKSVVSFFKKQSKVNLESIYETQ